MDMRRIGASEVLSELYVILGPETIMMDDPDQARYQPRQMTVRPRRIGVKPKQSPPDRLLNPFDEPMPVILG
jgi:hypothetical protein